MLMWWGGHSRFKSLGKGTDDYSASRGGSGLLLLQQQHGGGQSDILKHAKIGKFGEMVLGKSNVSFRCRAAPIIEIRAPPPPPQKRFTPFHSIHSFLMQIYYIHTYIYFFFSLIWSHRSYPEHTRAETGSTT